MEFSRNHASSPIDFTLEGEFEEATIQRLPDNVLELIFTHVNPYEDYNSVRLVSRRWFRIADATMRRMELYFKKCVNFTWNLVEGHHLLSERCSQVACYHPRESALYIFGGCNNTYTAFNDLWLFDLSRRDWERVRITKPLSPSAKALASMVLYKNNLLLFGGFSKSSMNPIHQTNTFYNELHMFNISSHCWEEIISENTAPHLAGHSASIVGNFMLVFGGSMGSSYNNNVYVLDLVRRIWNMPTIPGPCPPPRYGQSLILLDDRHLVVIGGCGGPNLMYSDVWLLDFDLNGDAEWRWTQLKVENLDLTPPYTWCHRAEKVGENAVIVSRPIKWNDISARRQSIRHGRRRTSSQSTSASGGSGRLASPDSPLDKKAVAAAFCTGSYEQLHQQQQQKIRKLLTSRSLDDQQRDNHHQSNEDMSSRTSDNARKSLQNSPNTCKDLAVSNSAFSSSLNTVPQHQQQQQKGAGELHRACSIPAIIVGEIPKLIVTASVEPSSAAGPSVAKTPTTNSAQRTSQQSNSNRTTAIGSKPHFGSLLNKDIHKSSGDVAGPSVSSDCDAVHEFYLSLVREEFHRLCIVEFSENLGDIDQRLEQFLSDRIGYLTKKERMEIITEFMHNVTSNSSESHRHPCHVVDSGQLEKRSKMSSDKASVPSTSGKHKLPTLSADDRPTDNVNSSDLIGTSFGPNYHRRMAVYVLRLRNALTEHRVSWEQLPVEEEAPEDKLLYSFTTCRGEIIVFGGMQSDESGMESLNVGLERRAMSSDTWILRPRYSDML